MYKSKTKPLTYTTAEKRPTFLWNENDTHRGHGRRSKKRVDNHNPIDHSRQRKFKMTAFIIRYFRAHARPKRHTRRP